MKKSKSPKKEPIKDLPLNNGITVGTIKDTALKADIKVKDRTVLIDISGFYNEFDAMVWARIQSEMWLRELYNNKDDKEPKNLTLH